MIVRDFYEELKDKNFKNITYTLFNKIDDECYVDFLNKKLNNIYSVDDFEYYDFDLSDKERFLIKMYNSEYLKNVKALQSKINNFIGVKVIIDHDFGRLIVVKLKDIRIYD